MIKDLTFVLVFLLICASTFGQSNGFSERTGHLHALLVGISDYHHLEDLEYADKDAELFSAFLKSTWPRREDTTNIVILTNEMAVSARIYAALENLVAFAGEGDEVYIYFSGHGDSENSTIFKSGFLLTYDTPRQSYYTNSINVDILNHFIHTLSVKNKANVTFIADACRSGHVQQQGGSGVMSTAKALAGSSADDVRLLSCQPEEISLEGPQWGGGSGLFTHHLIRGLYGLADAGTMKDGKVTLNELFIHLNTTVPRDAQPVQQYPGVYGPMHKVLAHVNQEVLIQMTDDSRKLTEFKDAGMKSGYEDQLIVGLDDEAQQIYRSFNTAMAEGRVREPQSENAYARWQSLEKVVEDEVLLNLLKRRLIVALHEESQLYIHQLGDISIKWQARDIRYGTWAMDMQLAAELAGPDHYLYPTMMGKHHFFKAADLYYKALKNPKAANVRSTLMLAQSSADKAIAQDELVNYYHLLKGYILQAQNNTAGAQSSFDEAIRLNPTFPYAYGGRAYNLIQSRAFEDAITACDRAIALDPTYNNAYMLKIKALKQLGRNDEVYDLYEQMIKAKPGASGM